MIDISNYARSLELKKFSMITESVEVDEAAQDRLAQLKSGKAGGPYAGHWKVAEDSIVKQVNSGKLTGQATVNYSTGGTMITVNWTVDPNTGKVAMTDASKPTAGAGSTNPKLDKLAETIAMALYKDTFTENEPLVIKTLVDNIKSEQQMQQFINYWKSLRITSTRGSQLFGTWQEFKAEQAKKNPNNGSNDYELKRWINMYFNDVQRSELNNKLKANNVTYQF